MRDLPRLLPKAGLRLIETQANVYAEAGSSSFMLNLAETYVPLAASTGQLPAAQVDAWLADQRRSASDGTFFAACNYYAYIAAKNSRDVAREQVGRLGRREVAAARHRRPAANVVEPLGPLARRGSLRDELVGEHAIAVGSHEVVRPDRGAVPAIVVVVAHRRPIVSVTQ